MININTLIKHKHSGKFATITAKYNKMVRDDNDWHAFSRGHDSCTIRTVVDILYHDGYKRRGVILSKITKNHEIISYGE